MSFPWPPGHNRAAGFPKALMPDSRMSWAASNPGLRVEGLGYPPGTVPNPRCMQKVLSTVAQGYQGARG